MSFFQRSKCRVLFWPKLVHRIQRQIGKEVPNEEFMQNSSADKTTLHWYKIILTSIQRTHRIACPEKPYHKDPVYHKFLMDETDLLMSDESWNPFLRSQTLKLPSRLNLKPKARLLNPTPSSWLQQAAVAEMIAEYYTIFTQYRTLADERHESWHTNLFLSVSRRGHFYCYALFL